jgi:hypothetical protein
MFLSRCVLLLVVSTVVAADVEWADVPWVGGFNQLRTEFEPPTSSPVSLLVTSLGCNEVFVNGEKVGSGLFEPGFSTVPTHRLLYNEHDVTSLLVDGPTNVIGVRLGTCKYGWMNTYCAEGSEKCLGFKLQLATKDGKRIAVFNASSWMGTASPFAADGPAYPKRVLWDGVRYNHSLELTGWSSPGFKPAGWQPAVEIIPPIEPLFFSPSTIPPITKHPPQGMPPVAVWSPSPGSFVADFGINMAGYTVLSLPAASTSFSHTVSALHGELIDKAEGVVANQFMSPPHNWDDCAHYGSCALQTDVYTLPEGHAAVVLEPAFTFHGEC